VVEPAETTAGVWFSMDLVRQFVRNSDGATAIEYGLIAAFIVVAIVGAAQTVGQALVPLFEAAANGLPQ
jgi:pilus assembly protein Flp/PilA